jgi:hypothetical protein
MLANCEQLPDLDSVAIFQRMNKELSNILVQKVTKEEKSELLHKLAHQMLLDAKVIEAWKVLLSV